MLKTTSFSEYILHDAEIISERVRGLMTDDNQDLEVKHNVASLGEQLRNALLSFEADARARKLPVAPNMSDLEPNPQSVAA